MNYKMLVPFLVVFLVGICISACGSSATKSEIENNDMNFSTPDKPIFFTGSIEEIIDDDRAIVLGSIVEENPEGLVFVNLSVNKNEKFQVGNKIKVGFDGTIMESNPAKINTLSVELID